MFNKIQCKICLSAFPDDKSFSNHVFKEHKMNIMEYINFNSRKHKKKVIQRTEVVYVNNI